MVLRWQEAAFPLALVLALVIGKYIPALDGLPLGRVAGVVCFSYAIFLSLRLVQGEEAVEVDGWSQLRPSALEVMGGLIAGAFAALLMAAVVFMSSQAANSAQLAAAFVLSLAFAACAIGIAATSLMIRVRWNHHTLEHRDCFGKLTSIAWAEVAGVKSHWRGITIWTRDRGRISFSPYHSGAAELMREALRVAERNAAAPRTDCWPLVE